MDKIIERLMGMADEGATADDMSQLLAKDGTALLRDLMQGYVDRRAEQERRVTVVGADGIECAEARASSRRIETPVGEIEVKRLLSQAPGVEGLAPLDAALGHPDEKYTHDARRIVAEERAKSSFDEVVELLEKRTGAHVPKRQVEEVTVRAAQDFDAFYATRLCEPEVTDDLLVLSFDAKGIAMRHTDLREATRKAAAAAPKLHARLAKGEKPNRKRMAQVATAYSIAPWSRMSADVLHGLRDARDKAQPRSTDKRVWASAQRSAQGGIDDTFAEATRRDPDHRRRWVVLVTRRRRRPAYPGRASGEPTPCGRSSALPPSRSHLKLVNDRNSSRRA